MAQIIESAILDNLDAVDPAYHGMFTQRNGKYEFDGVGGLKTQADIDRINGGLTKEKNDHKAARALLAQYGELKPEQVPDILRELDELRLTNGKVDDAKIEKLVESRINGKTAPLQSQLQKLTGQLTEAQQIIENFKQEKITTQIRDVLRKTLNESPGFKKEAIDDTVDLAERLFMLDEQGNVVAKDNVGVTPGIAPKDWLAEIQPKKHWLWGDSSGTGATGSGGQQNAGDNPWKAEQWNMTKQGELYKSNPTRAKQLAAAAGVQIGAMRPAVKK